MLLIWKYIYRKILNKIRLKPVMEELIPLTRNLLKRSQRTVYTEFPKEKNQNVLLSQTFSWKLT